MELESREKTIVNPGRNMDSTEPVTDFDSKTVMLRAERQDPIAITEVIDSSIPEKNFPDQFIVSRRTDTYFGPKLLLNANDQPHLLTAPGPDAYLLLWKLETESDRGKQWWRQVAEVRADFDDDPPAYNICPDCGEPIQTAEHERMSLLGRCSGAS